MDRINVGIVGAGFAAGSHIEAVRRVPGLAIVGIAASTPQRSRAAATAFGLDRAFDSFEGCKRIFLRSMSCSLGQGLFVRAPHVRDGRDYFAVVTVAQAIPKALAASR